MKGLKVGGWAAEPSDYGRPPDFHNAPRESTKLRRTSSQSQQVASGVHQNDTALAPSCQSFYLVSSMPGMQRSHAEMSRRRLQQGQQRLLAVVLILTIISQVAGECMNACTGHGKCTMWDMCMCARNWQGNDCSERTCMFGRAWVDSPKGDLDSSESISGPLDPVVVNSAPYPYGTSESFPNMVNSDHEQLDQTAHDYAECSNVGNCDRNTGVCDCQPGFEGSACNRMTCPSYLDSENAIYYPHYSGKCSGHGVCRSLKNIAKHDNNHRYNLWDRDQSTACICDPGYFGGDCQQRSCKKDMDPLYLDDVTTMQYGRYYFPLLTTESGATFSNGVGGGKGKFNIIIYDQRDQPYQTTNLDIDCTCADVIAALEGLPHNLVPKATVECQLLDIFELNPLEERPAWEFKRMSRYTAYQDGQDREHIFAVHPTFWLQGHETVELGTNTTSKDNVATAGTTDKYLSGKIFHMEFLGTYGDLKEPEINLFTDPDSKRPTMHVDRGHLMTNVWSDGNRVEGTNHWANHCHDLHVSLDVDSSGYIFLTGFNHQEKRTLKRCLGGSDHDESNNGDSSNVDWDHGNENFPHMIRLVRTVTDVTDSGFYVPIVYDTTTTGLDDSSDTRDWHILHKSADPTYTDGTFKVLIPFEGLDRIKYVDETTNQVQYEVYTTKGVLQRVGNQTEVAFDFASKTIYTTNVEEGVEYDGNVACRLEGQGGQYNQQYDQYTACISKGDYFFMFDYNNLNYNPMHLNLHRAVSVYSDDDNSRGTHISTMDVHSGYAAEYKVGKHASKLAKYKTHMIISDIATNWAQEVDGAAVFNLYKFFPHFESTYNYVAECSNRGLCNNFEGLCECFPGYTGDACSDQDTLTL